jgi:homoserine O-acetyltransferase
MDLFDAAEGFESTTDALANVKCPVMVIGVQTDALFPVTQQREIAEALKDSGNDAVTYFELDSIYGN